MLLPSKPLITSLICTKEMLIVDMKSPVLSWWLECHNIYLHCIVTYQWEVLIWNFQFQEQLNYSHLSKKHVFSRTAMRFRQPIPNTKYQHQNHQNYYSMSPLFSWANRVFTFAWRDCSIHFCSHLMAMLGS